jgi:hypothetical protein
MKDVFVKISFIALPFFPSGCLPCVSGNTTFPRWPFSKKIRRKAGRAGPSSTRENISQLQNYEWPGNIRELETLSNAP